MISFDYTRLSYMFVSCCLGQSTITSPLCPPISFIMASGALFPSMVSGSRGSSSKYLVEFRAGKMTMKGSTVTPDKRKGQVYIQQTDDSLIHFCWKDRTTGNVDDVGDNICAVLTRCCVSQNFSGECRMLTLTS